MFLNFELLSYGGTTPVRLFPMSHNVQGRRCFVHSKHRDEMAANLVLCDVDGYFTKKPWGKNYDIQYLLTIQINLDNANKFCLLKL